MKKFVLFLLVLSTSVGHLSAQDEGIMSNFTISGDLRMGSNYLPLFGFHATDNVALYTELMAVHTSGLGLGYFASDDFSNEATGRIRFVDALYTKSWNEWSIYTAFEYVWYDNNKDGECVMPYAIGTYTHNSWSFQLATMTTYFPHKDQDKWEFTMYGKVSKNIFRDVDAHVTIWYDSMLKSHVYGAAGVKVSLPRRFYVMGSLLYRDNADGVISVGWRF